MWWITDKYYRIVGECLSAAREHAGVSQDALAALLGKPQSFVSSYERGQRRVDIVELLLIADTLKADRLALFGEIAGHVPKLGPQRKTTDTHKDQ